MSCGFVFQRSEQVMNRQPAKQNDLGDLMTALWQWWRGAPLSARIEVAAGVLALVVALCASGGLLSSLNSGITHAAPQANTTPTPKPKTWHTIAAFSGSGNVQTPSLAIPDGARVVWSLVPTPAQGIDGTLVIVDLYDATSSQPTDELINQANVTSAATGTYTFHGGGQYYFLVTANAVNWTIQVQIYS
jgi:hypothetical protein